MPGTVADLAEEAFTRAPMNRPLQALFVALFAVPQLAIYALQPDSSAYLELAGLLKPAVLLSSWQRWLQDPKFILVLVLLSFERFVYTMVWLFPAHFVHFAQMYIRPLLLKTTGKGKPLDCIVSLFWLSKIFQFGSMFGFYFSVGPLPAVASISLFRWVLGLQLMLLGQLLNAAIYNAIGKAGVYYGYKIGVPVPWCTGFPFNVFTMHPQYMGVCMSIVGGGILMVTEEQAYAGFVGVGLSATLFYLYMSMVEDMPCEHPADKTQGGPTKDRRLRDLRNLKWSTHLSKTWDTTDNVLGFMARPWFPTVVAAAALLNCFLLVVPVNLLFVVFCIRNSYSVLPSALNVAGGAPRPADAKPLAPPRAAPTAAPPTSSTPISSTLRSPRPPRPPHPPYTHPTPTLHPPARPRPQPWPRLAPTPTPARHSAPAQASPSAWRCSRGRSRPRVGPTPTRSAWAASASPCPPSRLNRTGRSPTTRSWKRGLTAASPPSASHTRSRLCASPSGTPPACPCRRSSSPPPSPSSSTIRSSAPAPSRSPG